MADETLHIKSDLKILAQIRLFLRRVFTDISLDPVERMELAANEVAANIIKHAYKDRPQQPITIRATTHPDRICVHFTDKGASFVLEDVPLPNFDGSREGGFGLFIVSQVVDQFTYHPGKDKNHTMLCIFLA